MLISIAYYQIFGKPLVYYVGIGTYLLFLGAAAVALLNMRGNHRIPFKWHKRLAYAGLLLGLLHGVLAMSQYVAIK